MHPAERKGREKQSKSRTQFVGRAVVHCHFVVGCCQHVADNACLVQQDVTLCEGDASKKWE